MTGTPVFARGVDAGVEGFEGGGVDVVVVGEDLVEVVLGVAVDDGDAGAGGEIVELVEGDLLPVGVEAAGRDRRRRRARRSEASFSALSVAVSLVRMLRLWAAWVV